MSTPTGHTRPLAVFFAQFQPGFEYNPDNSATAELSRLNKYKRWNDKKWKAVKQGFQDALTKQFNNNYGTDIDALTNWQALCAKVGMNPLPESLEACRKAIRETHVNLVDLVDIFDTPKIARTFSTLAELSEYTRKEGKIFPKENAYAGNLLRFLLRRILSRRAPNQGGSGRGRLAIRRGRGARRSVKESVL